MMINFVTFHTCYETGGLFSLVFLNVQSEIQPLCGVYGTHTNIIPQLSDILLLCMMIVVWAPSRGLSSRVYNSRVLTTKPLRNGRFKFVYNCSQQNGLKLQKKIKIWDCRNPFRRRGRNYELFWKLYWNAYPMT